MDMASVSFFIRYHLPSNHLPRIHHILSINQLIFALTTRKSYRLHSGFSIRHSILLCCYGESIFLFYVSGHRLHLILFCENHQVSLSQPFTSNENLLSMYEFIQHSYLIYMVTATMALRECLTEMKQSIIHE